MYNQIEERYYKKNPFEMTEQEAKYSAVYWRAKYETLKEENVVISGVESIPPINIENN